MNWYLDVLRKYADFDGRASRTEFWMFTLINIIISVILSFVRLLAGGPGVVLDILYYLGVLIPGIAVAVRRLHDTGRSGWWMLITIIPVIDLILLIFFVQAT